MVYCHYKVCHIIWSSASIQMASCWSNKKWSELFEEKRKYLWKIPEKKMFKKDRKNKTHRKDNTNYKRARSN